MADLQALLILAHPKPGSFNHAIAEAVLAGLRERSVRVAFHDLYAEGFDPVMTQDEIDSGRSEDALVEQHCQELARAHLIAVVHPNWWGQPPAILKGWVDRVVRQGLAYRFSEKGPQGLLRARMALVFNTANTPLEDELRLFGDPLANLWGACTFDFVGIPDVRRRLYEPVIVSTLEQRQEWLRDVAGTVQAAVDALSAAD